MEKLNIHDTSGLTRYAISAGIIESSVQIKEDWLYIKERGNQAYPI
jgi:hypothetical protein